jgi:hypothetical protein
MEVIKKEEERRSWDGGASRATVFVVMAARWDW